MPLENKNILEYMIFVSVYSIIQEIRNGCITHKQMLILGLVVGLKGTNMNDYSCTVIGSFNIVLPQYKY